jgi:integrase
LAERIFAGYSRLTTFRNSASLLLASGLDVKVVQTHRRHSSSKTTLGTYGHLWPDSDDSTRAAIDSVIAALAPVADNLRPGRPR